MASIHQPAISRNLDALRALAVLCVFFSHLLESSGLAHVINLGRFGVVMFFFHTSLVLIESMERMVMDSASRLRLLGAFWLRRVFRIYPLAILCVLTVFLLHVPRNPGDVFIPIGGKELFANLLLIQNLTTSSTVLTPLWSLPLEVQMYLVLPFLFLLLGVWRGGRGWGVLLLWAAAVLCAIVLPRINWRLQVAAFAPCFAAGVVAFQLLRAGVRRTLPAWLWPVGIAVAILLFGPADNVNLYQKLYRAWFLSLGLALLYVTTREAEQSWLQVVWHWIAEHSYGIYLSHLVLIWAVLVPLKFLPWPLRAILLIGSSVGVPAFLYWAVERPLQLTGSHLSRRVLRATAREQFGLRGVENTNRPHHG